MQHACPKERRQGQRRIAETWKRGQNVEIIWHKNNHNGGFYRRSLVPVQHMYSHEWHRKTAFEWGCWSQGTFKCGQNAVCGADGKGLAYKNYATVPDSIPDGVYAFAQVWYGGVDWTLKIAKYSDYYACSFVRIKGGKPLRSSYTAKFKPSPVKRKGVPLGQCRTGAIRALQCRGGECIKNKVIFSIPQEFQRGRKPAVPYSAYNAKGTQRLLRETASEEKKNSEEAKKDAQEDAKDVRDMQRAGKVEEEPDNPLMAFKITIGGRTTTLMGGQTKTINVRGRPWVEITVDTGRQRPSPVYMRVPGARNTKTERVHPYEFPWKVSPGMHTLTARTGPYSLTARLRVRVQGGGSGGNRRNGNRRTGGCSRGNIPPRPRGSWGPRDSGRWFRQRAAWYKRYNYCLRCQYRCRM